MGKMEESFSSVLHAVSEKAQTTERNGSDESMPKRIKSMHPTGINHAGSLKLVGEGAPQHVSWEYRLRDEERRSFAGHLPGALPKSIADSFFKIVDEGTPWIRGGPRWTAWMTKHPCSCAYAYSATAEPLSVGVVEASSWPDWMDELLRHVMPLCGIEASGWPNSCNLNSYIDGYDGVGWHTDDEPLFQGAYQDCLIVSLSLGQAREFSLCLADAWDRWQVEGSDCSEFYDDWGEVSMSLGHGDLCTMEGLTQKYYRHAAPCCEDEGLKQRLNLTWRWIVQHKASCALSDRVIEPSCKAMDDGEIHDKHDDWQNLLDEDGASVLVRCLRSDYSTIPCKFHARGWCARGAQCAYQHGPIV
jgi:alkylated DNA repair dioxygenase AlkB